MEKGIPPLGMKFVTSHRAELENFYQEATKRQLAGVLPISVSQDGCEHCSDEYDSWKYCYNCSLHEPRSGTISILWRGTLCFVISFDSRIDPANLDLLHTIDAVLTSARVADNKLYPWRGPASMEFPQHKLRYESYCEGDNMEFRLSEKIVKTLTGETIYEGEFFGHFTNIY